MSICIYLLSPCHHDTTRPQVAALEDGLQMWAAAASVLNKQLQIAENGWLSRLKAGRMSKSPHHENTL
jgi:hypothetical protein